MEKELTVVIPTYNELNNIKPLLQLLNQALKEISWEVIFVDDNSPDGTANLIHEIGQKDNRIICINRHSKLGLSSACIKGIQYSTTPYIAVMDADLQHDEQILPRMLNCLKNEQLDIVVASRYISGGSLGAISPVRSFFSRTATKFGQLITGVPLKDPLSGYFLLTRQFFNQTLPSLNGEGFKILLDIYLSASKPVKFKEIPYEFRQRKEGKSKLSTKEIWNYLDLIIKKSKNKIT